MRTAIKFIVAISFVTLAVLIILPFILIYLKISIEPFDRYISAVGSIIVILLMLVTIILTENATIKQAESWEKWELIQRKQSLKSLIKEFKLNIEVYESVQKNLLEENINPKFNNFILTSLEKSLYNSPVDNEKINDNLLSMYYIMKIHDNKITATRIPNLQKKGISGLFTSITKDYEANKKLIDTTIKMLEEYEQKINDIIYVTLNPMTGYSIITKILSHIIL